ncbi:hypothetical protein ACP4OV_022027 [Aristida adscensionis]
MAARRRGPVELRRIEDRVSRQVRFSKRRAGLFKKALELSLCDAQVALLVFSPAGKLFHYASTSLEDTYDRYQKFARAGKNVKNGNQKSNDGKENVADQDVLVQKQDEASGDLQSRLREIASWSLQNNADEADPSELEKLEKLLTNALRDTKSKKHVGEPGQWRAEYKLPDMNED